MKFTLAERQYYTANDFQVGDWVSFMNSRGWDITGEIVKKFETKAKVKDEDTGEIFTAQYTQLAKLDKPTQATRNTNKLTNVLHSDE